MFKVSRPVSDLIKSKDEDEVGGSNIKSREEWRKAKELEEARKSGTAPAAVDEEGNDINPHIPQYISDAPWYVNTSGPTLKHQRPTEKPKNYASINEYYQRGQRGATATKFRKGACENCGALTHRKKDCVERPRKIGVKYNTDNIAADEKLLPNLILDYDGKRDRWAGFEPEMYKDLVVDEYEKVEEAKRELKKQKMDKEVALAPKETDDTPVAGPSAPFANEDEEESHAVSDSDDDADEKYADHIDMPGTKVDSKQRITVRNLRIREDTAKYLRNLNPDSAYYDPKTRAMRENPHEGAKRAAQDIYAGDNFVRYSGDTLNVMDVQKFSWQASDKGIDINLSSEPTKAEILHKEYKEKRGEIKQSVKSTVLEKYGGAEYLEAPPPELIFAQTENYVEYSRQGKLIKGQEKVAVKSSYEEDTYYGNHSSVFGSWWHEGHWGYRCCHSKIKQSYCTGDSGKVALSELENLNNIKEWKEKEREREREEKREVHCQDCSECRQFIGDLTAANDNLADKLRSNEHRCQDLERRLAAVNRITCDLSSTIVCAKTINKGDLTIKRRSSDDSGHISLIICEDEDGLCDVTVTRTDLRSSGPSSSSSPSEPDDDLRAARSHDCSSTSGRGSSCSGSLTSSNCVDTSTQTEQDCSCHPITCGDDKGVQASVDDDKQLSAIQCKSEQIEVELRQQVEKLLEEKGSLTEQVLELEEAENDSRSLSQKLQCQVNQLCDQMDNLKSALHDARSTNEKQAARVRMLEADSSNGQSEIDEDLQLFISPSEMADSGSSFEPSSMVHICKAKTKDLTVVLPLCETAKAKKIDVMMVSPGGTVHKVTSGDQFSDTVDIMDKLTALEANERQLRDQLLNLEWINKQFIQELELRESLLSQKQSNMNEDYIALEETIKNLEHTLDIVQDRKMTLESEQSKVRQAMDKRRTETRPVRPPRIRSRRLSIDGAVDMVQREDSTRSLTACRIELFNPTLDNVLVELEEKEDQLCNQFEQIHNEELELERSLADKRCELEHLRSRRSESMKDLEQKQCSVVNAIRERMCSMASKSSKTVSQLEEERKQIWSGLESAARAFCSRESVLGSKIHDLEHKVQSELVELQKKLDSEENAALVLRKELQEAVGKEVAFRETLSKADGLFAELEQKYRDQVSELEETERQLRSELDEVRESAAEVNKKANFKLSRSSSCLRCLLAEQSERNNDLVQEAIEEYEAREFILQERVCTLEDCERQLQERIRALEMNKSNMEKEMEEQDEMMADMVKVQGTVDKLQSELDKTAAETEAIKKLLRDTEQFYQEREADLEARLGQVNHDCKRLRSRIHDLVNERQRLEDTFVESSCPSLPSLSQELQLGSPSGCSSLSSSVNDVSNCKSDSLVRKAVNSLERRLRDQKRQQVATVGQP
ncbi:Pre-mRNA-splicing factor SLU7 [Halotydeus destructor]|nr:Pre-mRNA-splicing factor SLU7 [Halotydeus destructor]